MRKASARIEKGVQVGKFLLISSVTLALVGCAPSSPRTPPEQKQPVSTSVEEIRAKFAENQIGGAQFFETRKAVLTGEVVRVREALGAGILVFKSAKSGIEAELAFDADGTMALGNLHSGDRVAVTCPIIEEVLGQVMIGCSTVTLLQNGPARNN